MDFNQLTFARCSAIERKWPIRLRVAYHFWIITLLSAACRTPVWFKIRGTTEKYLLREAAKPVITEKVYRREKHPFHTPLTTTAPTERFHQMLQDTLRSSVFASVPFYDQKEVVAVLDRIPTMSDSDRIAWDPVLIWVLSACVLQDRFGLGTKTAGNDAFAVGSHPKTAREVEAASPAA